MSYVSPLNVNDVMQNYCLVADLLGFSNLMLNLPSDLQSVRVAQWTDLVNTAASNAGISQYQMVSDTVFAGADPTAEGLKRLIAMCQSLLQHGVPSALPIRASIALGDVSWGTVTFGKPIVDAFRLSNDQVWIGACLHESVTHQQYSWDSLIVYPVPLKSGPIQLRPTIAWQIPALEEFMRAVCDQGLTKEGELLSWEWLNKVQNTLLFGMYIRLLSQYPTQISAEHFRGITPIGIFEQMSRSQVLVTALEVSGEQKPIARLTLGCPDDSCRTRDLPQMLQQ
jgi:hypothetical protein